MAVNLDVFLINLAIHVIINAVILSPVLWISGRLLAGKDKARFLDALWIAVLGTAIADVLGIFIVGFIATLIVLLIWIALTKHFFDCGWLKAIAIGHNSNTNADSHSCNTGIARDSHINTDIAPNIKHHSFFSEIPNSGYFENRKKHPILNV
jgi:hypothetical protein